MKKLLVCALTSRDPARLARLIQSVCGQYPCPHITWSGLVVCNTLDADYSREALVVACAYGWDFAVTKSNGKPGKGKNSALELFSKLPNTEHDYLLLLDGDDFLYPTAFQQIHRLLLSQPDVVGLQTNDTIENVVYPNMSCTQLADDKYLYSWFNQQQNLYALPQYWGKVDRSRTLGEHSTPDRIILFSKDAANVLRCSEELPVYEDYVLSLQAQYRMLMGHLVYINTATTYIYVYDKSMDVSTCKLFDKEVGDWSAPNDVFLQSIKHLEPILADFHASEVPFVTIPLPSATQFSTEDRIQYLQKNLL